MDKPDMLAAPLAPVLVVPKPNGKLAGAWQRLAYGARLLRRDKGACWGWR